MIPSDYDDSSDYSVIDQNDNMNQNINEYLLVLPSRKKKWIIYSSNNNNNNNNNHHNNNDKKKQNKNKNDDCYLYHDDNDWYWHDWGINVTPTISVPPNIQKMDIYGFYNLQLYCSSYSIEIVLDYNQWKKYKQQQDWKIKLETIRDAQNKFEICARCLFESFKHEFDYNFE